MIFKKLKKIIASTTVIATLLSNCAVYAATTNSSSTATSTANSIDVNSSSSSNENVLSVDVDDNGSVSYTVPVSTENRENQQFSWDNASVYFAMTDRFYNGDTSNDHSYGRSTNEQDASSYATRQGTFHGGDLKGLTQKLNEGYFEKLGINAIWITAPYEQIHGAVCSNGFKHYPYEGYWTLDFSNMDANMGTEEDLANFIDTAHSQGIRVVFDIVMNHVGYADPVTANEYGFGKLSSEWKDIYYNWNESQYKWYYDYDVEAQANGASTGIMVYDGDWTSNWWGTDWIRAVSKRFKGYEGSESGDDLTLCTSGLPDLKMENSSSVSLPSILANKWKKEGRYDKEMQELNNWFSAGHNKSVSSYMIKWLTDWVREYGVDGFRCDTAKHVPLSCWKELKDESNKALKEWRTNNPTKAGAKWTDNFWMTGEVFGSGVGSCGNYFTNGFDSIINFGFQGCAFTSYSGIDSTYSNYANTINSNSTSNYLSYISSHDKGLARGDMKVAGTNLLLCPGAIQIFYGDETNRKAVGSDNEMAWRGQMNWDSIDTEVLAHWQKVGTFRNNHLAVGAGTHTKLNASPYTFSRTYDKDGVNDAVVCCLPGTAGTYDVKVGDAFSDGQQVKDAYSGQTYTVTGGSVSVTCDSNGVILLERNGGIVTGISATGVKDGTYSYENTLTVKLNATEKATDLKYSLNGAAAKSYTNGDTITIGSGLANGDLTTLKVTGKNESGEALSASYTYKKIIIPYNSGYVYAKAPSGWGSTMNAYIYDESTGTAKKVAAWPGTKMTYNEEYGRYELEIPAEFQTDKTQIIFNDGSNQNPGGQKPGVYYETGKAMVFDGTDIKIVETTEDKLTAGVISTDKDSHQNVGTSIKITTTEATNGSGNYEYKFVVVDENNNETLVKDYSNSMTATWTPNVAGNYTIKVYSKDVTKDKEVSASKSFAIDKPQGPQVTATKVSIKSPAQVGDTIKVSAAATGTGTVKYKYIILDSSSKIVYSTGYSKRGYTTWTPSEAGKYSINIKVKDSTGAEAIKTLSYEVKEAPGCTLTSVTTSKTSPQVAGTAIKISAAAEADTTVSYKFWVHEIDGEWTLIKNYSTKNSAIWTPDKAGTYIIWVDAKDEKGNRDFKAITYIVK